MALLRLTAWLIVRYLPRIGRPRHPGVRLAVANMYRPGTLTPDVVLSLGLGLTVLVAVALVVGWWRGSWGNGGKGRGWVP